MSVILRHSPIKRRTNLLCHYDYRHGMNRDGQPVTVDGIVGTFERAGVKRAVDSNGRVYVAPYGFPAIHHVYNAGVWAPVGVLLEHAVTNLCLQSENFGATWVATGSPTRTAQAARCGSVYLDLIGDDDAGGLEYYSQQINFTGDAVKSISLFIRQGTSTSTLIRLHDSTASQNRILAAITWSAGVPVVTMTTGTNLLAGATYPATRLQDANGNSVWQLYLQSTSVTASNTHSMQVFPATDAALATSSTGNVYVGGVQVADQIVPSSYIPTTSGTVTRAADTLTFPFRKLPGPMTVYVKRREMGTQQYSSGSWEIGAFGTGPALGSYVPTAGTPGTKGAFHDNATDSTVLSGTVTGPAFYDTVEERIVLAATGTVTYAQRLPDVAGAESVGAASSAPAAGLAATAWSGEFIRFNGYTGVTEGLSAFEIVKVAAGVRTLAQMRSAV